MDDESGKSMEPMEEVPLKELGESVSLNLRNWCAVDEEKPGVDSRDEGKPQAYWKERSVIRREDDVDSLGKEVSINSSPSQCHCEVGLGCVMRQAARNERIYQPTYLVSSAMLVN